jgi:hypothetical protein
VVRKRDLLTRLLAAVGTVLADLPILATLLFGLLRFTSARILRIDFLMPAELFPAAVVGGGLLTWAAYRAGTRRGLIVWSFGLCIALLFGGQVIAVASGLASGEAEPVGLPWAMVMTSLAGYVAALAALGVGGILLTCDLFRHASQASEASVPPG